MRASYTAALLAAAAAPLAAAHDHNNGTVTTTEVLVSTLTRASVTSTITQTSVRVVPTGGHRWAGAPDDCANVTGTLATVTGSRPTGFVSLPPGGPGAPGAPGSNGDDSDCYWAYSDSPAWPGVPSNGTWATGSMGLAYPTGTVAYPSGTAVGGLSGAPAPTSTLICPSNSRTPPTPTSSPNGGVVSVPTTTSQPPASQPTGNQNNGPNAANAAPATKAVGAWSFVVVAAAAAALAL